MASEPKWEKWRRMDCAHLYEWVALFSGLDPDAVQVLPEDFTMESVLFRHVNEDFIDTLRIAESSVSAGTLSCCSFSLYRAGMREVLMSEFLRWARSKELPVPPELKPVGVIGTASNVEPSSDRVEGIKGLRELIKELGLHLGHDSAVRSFAKQAGIMETGSNLRHGRLSFDRATIEPKLRAAIEERRRKEAE